MADADCTTQHRRDIVNRHNRKLRARAEHEIPYPTEKRCAACQQVKPAAAFTKMRGSRDGLRPRCKLCLSVEHHEKHAPKERKRRINPALLERLGKEVPVPRVENSPDGPIMRVPLTQGAFAVIDPADWPLVAGRNWHLTSGYAVSNADQRGAGPIYMHVMIFGGAGPNDVDHKDRDRLNNRRANLRSATRSLNHANKPKGGRALLSRFKGVRQLPSGRWDCRVGGDHVGTFDTEEAAARAYDTEARARYGEFAVLNFSD